MAARVARANAVDVESTSILRALVVNNAANFGTVRA